MSIEGFLAPWGIYAAVLLLHLVLPARHVEGYVRDATGAPLRYRLNGWLVAVVSIGLWYALGATELVAWDWLYQVRWESLAGAVVMGLAFTAWVVFKEPAGGRSLPVELFLGRADNPQWLGGRVDAKMFLYLVGATMLALNLLAMGAHHLIAHPDATSPGVYLYIALFFWFIFDYFTFERVHLYTYDLFAEKVGFKLGWGCLAFYPFFYGVGLWTVAEMPSSARSMLWYAFSAVVFFTGWALARGANMQKFVFKRDPTKSFLGIAPETVTDGRKTLLVNGFWGVSRHVNYLGEVLMATGLTLALGYPEVWWTWLYPAYYVALLFPRERDDDRRCAAKYGPLWDAYRAKVPKRIIPGIY